MSKALKHKPEGDPASDDNLWDGVAYLHGQLHAERESRGDEGAAQQKRQEYGGFGRPHFLEVKWRSIVECAMIGTNQTAHLHCIKCHVHNTTKDTPKISGR